MAKGIDLSDVLKTIPNKEKAQKWLLSKIKSRYPRFTGDFKNLKGIDEVGYPIYTDLVEFNNVKKKAEDSNEMIFVFQGLEYKLDKDQFAPLPYKTDALDTQEIKPPAKEYIKPVEKVVEVPEKRFRKVYDYQNILALMEGTYTDKTKAFVLDWEIGKCFEPYHTEINAKNSIFRKVRVTDMTATIWDKIKEVFVGKEYYYRLQGQRQVCLKVFIKYFCKYMIPYLKEKGFDGIRAYNDDTKLKPVSLDEFVSRQHSFNV